MHTLVMLHLPNAHTGKVTFAKCTHFNNAIIDKMHTSVMLHLLNENSYSYGYMSQKTGASKNLNLIAMFNVSVDE